MTVPNISSRGSMRIPRPRCIGSCRHSGQALPRWIWARLDQQRGASQVALEDLIERLDFDLTTAGVRAVQVQSERPLHNLAIDYLVLGSRLGTEVLRRALARDMAREDMPTYFLAPSTGALWQRHCRTLDDIPVDSSEAARIIEDVKHGFSLFEQAAALQDRAQSAPKTEGEPA